MRLGIVLVCACVAMAIAAPAMPDAEKDEVPDIADIMMSLARDNNVDIEDLGKIIARDQPNSGVSVMAYILYFLKKCKKDHLLG